jgi:hypothetical protein
MSGRIGRTGRVRSSAWICGFSPAQITTAFSGGARYRPTTSRTLASGCGSVENLNPSVRCGCRQNLRHRTAIESWLTLMPLTWPSQPASRRLDQCVTPAARKDSGGGVTVAARIWHTTSSVSTVFGPRGRRASSSPASPDSAYWRRHLITVGSVQPTRSAICAPVSPAAPSSTIRARSTTRAGAPFARARLRPASPAPSGHDRTLSGCARDSAYAIVPRFHGNIKKDIRQNTGAS